MAGDRGRLFGVTTLGVRRVFEFPFDVDDAGRPIATSLSSSFSQSRRLSHFDILWHRRFLGSETSSRSDSNERILQGRIVSSKGCAASILLSDVERVIDWVVRMFRLEGSVSDGFEVEIR